MKLATTLASLAALLCVPAGAAAQNRFDTPRTAGDPLGSTYTAELLRDLPTADNLFHLIDALQPTIIADRFSGGGLSTARPARLGGFGPSWTQTRFSIAGVDVSDPTGSGLPMLVPELLLWQRIHVGTGAFGADNRAQGLSIELTPPTPGPTWSSVAEGALSHGRMNATGSGDALPPALRLTGYDRLSFLANGPLQRDRLGATLGLSMTRNSEADRRDTLPVDASQLSVFTQLRFTPNDTNDVQVIGWAQKTDAPSALRWDLISSKPASASTSGAHGQLTWINRGHASAPWQLSASYNDRRDTPDTQHAAGGILERLTDGPVTQFTSLAHQTVRSWTASVRRDSDHQAGSITHHVSLGADADGGQLIANSAFTGAIGELVHGSPARIWQFTNPGIDSNRHVTTLAAWAQDRFALGTLDLAAGVRFDATRGSAKGATQNISWQNLLPNASLSLPLTEQRGLSLFSSYSRTAARLTLDQLAWGDPAASTASIYRWTSLAGYPLNLNDRGDLIMRVGPGTGGDAAFSSIDPKLQRLVQDEFAVGLTARAGDTFMFRLAGLTRKERHLAGILDIGTPQYTSFSQADPGGNVLDPADDTVVTVYNRIPSSYLKDRYQLTNPGQDGSTFNGIELTLQFNTKRMLFSGSGTAGITETFANTIGYGPLENDQSLLGDLYINPNALAFANGRPFTDRAFTGKIATIVRLPAETRLGALIRYQDGQPFSRLVVFPGLNQGAEAVRAFPAGDSRFKFVGTLDLRLSKTFDVNGRQVEGFIDGYNVLNLRFSVEEDVAGLPDVRNDIALQPPFALHIGARVRF